MEIIFLSIACIANSVAIILHLVSHFRGNQRKGFGDSYADLKRAMEMQRFMDRAVKASDRFIDKFHHFYGSTVSN